MRHGLNGEEPILYYAFHATQYLLEIKMLFVVFEESILIKS